MREKLIELLETVVSPKELLCYGEVLVSTSRVADHLIANDVVQVVRCKDCRHGEIDDPDFPNQHYCHEGCGWNDGDFFCSYGERKDNG